MDVRIKEGCEDNLRELLVEFFRKQEYAFCLFRVELQELHIFAEEPRLRITTKMDATKY